MSANEVQQRTSISNASSYEEIGEFWDTHSLADYWDQTYQVEMEIRLPRPHRVNIEAEIFERVGQEARHRGVSRETLINLWIAERLQTLATGPDKKIRHETGRPAIELMEKQLAEEKASYPAE